MGGLGRIDPARGILREGWMGTPQRGLNFEKKRKAPESDLSPRSVLPVRIYPSPLPSPIPESILLPGAISNSRDLSILSPGSIPRTSNLLP